MAPAKRTMEPIIILRPAALGIVLVNPKFAHNVGAVVRLASAYGVRNVIFTGDRVEADLLESDSGRLPREERMKGYKDVWFRRNDKPMSARFERYIGPAAAKWIEPDLITPVAVEVREGSEPLHTFVHPENAVYVFGPEDGDIGGGIASVCHRFVVIPTRHCLNLATAVATVLWDRYVKNQPEAQFVTPGAWEQRGMR